MDSVPVENLSYTKTYTVMRSKNTKEIIINGVRYYVAIRLDSHWSYLADWWNQSEPPKNALDGAVRTDPNAEREAKDEIEKAHLKQEPWLYAEIAAGDPGNGESEAKATVLDIAERPDFRGA